MDRSPRTTRLLLSACDAIEPAEPIEIGDEASFLVVRRGQVQLTTRPGSSAYLIEPLSTGRAAAVLACPVGHAVRINGALSPRVVLLHEGDELVFPESALTLRLSLAVIVSRIVCPPPAEAAGAICPICRSRIAADAQVYLCECGLAMHLEKPDRGADRLECAAVASECPNCERAIQLAAQPATREELTHADR